MAAENAKLPRSPRLPKVSKRRIESWLKRLKCASRCVEARRRTGRQRFIADVRRTMRMPGFLPEAEILGRPATNAAEDVEAAFATIIASAFATIIASAPRSEPAELNLFDGVAKEEVQKEYEGLLRDINKHAFIVAKNISSNLPSSPRLTKRERKSIKSWLKRLRCASRCVRGKGTQTRRQIGISGVRRTMRGRRSPIIRPMGNPSWSSSSSSSSSYDLHAQV